MAQSEAFFHRWGALAVFFARFVPPIRAFVPITAGALGMPPLRFYSVNIPAILVVGPGACAAGRAGGVGVAPNMPDCRITSMSASICGCWR